MIFRVPRDTTFRWSAGGLDIESTVYEAEEPRRIVWGGPAHGITGIHLWTFDVTGSAVRVRTPYFTGNLDTQDLRHG